MNPDIHLSIFCFNLKSCNLFKNNDCIILVKLLQFYPIEDDILIAQGHSFMKCAHGEKRCQYDQEHDPNIKGNG